MANKDELLTTSAAAREYGYNAEYLRRLAKSGELPATKLGRDWVIKRSDLLAYIAKVQKRGAREGRKLAVDFLHGIRII